MRITLFCLAVCALAPTIRDEQRLNLAVPVTGELRITDPRLLQPCDVGFVVAQIGGAFNVPVGFENRRDCWLSRRGKPGLETEGTEDLIGMSARQALDHLMTFMPAYSWRELGGVIVARPKSAWDDPQNVLNFPTAAFETTNQPLRDVLHTLLDGVRPKALVPHRDVPLRTDRPIDQPVTVVFRGGTMLEAVNEIARARTGVYWQLAYDSIPGRATIEFGTFDFSGIVLASVGVPQEAR
jgi:hypothetical protein